MRNGKRKAGPATARHTVLLACGVASGLSLLGSAAWLSGAPAAQAASAQSAAAAPGQEQPVDLLADSLSHDDKSQTVTARGHVELTQAGRKLRADEVVYNLRTDAVTARGNVTLYEDNGDVHRADEVQLSDQMKNGFVKSLRTLLADGSRFTAEEGQRENGTKIVLDHATYTPCEPCKADPEKPPLWAIKAREVTHDEAEHRISYKDATFEIAGVPVMWAPYFSHSDGTIKRKSGFLPVKLGWDSELGGIMSNSYYIDIAPDKDATVGMMLTTKEPPLMFGEWRQRWDQARLTASGSVTYSQRTDSVANENVRKDEELRGHLFADGLWDIDDKWRSGVKLQVSSDEQYLRQYDLSSEDVLENEIYAERFSGRNYAVIRALAFEDVRVREERADQPDILPEIEANFLGEPGQMLGGRWSFHVSGLGMERQGSGQDMNRMIVEAGWQRRYISDAGVVAKADATLRGDAYAVRDRDIATPGSGRSSDSNEVRAFPQANFEVSYPFVKPLEAAQVVVEPVVSVTAAPNLDFDGDIPNEDSQDVQVDASNIFEANRFPGKDGIEDKSRVTYGARTGFYGVGGSQAYLFLGQSYRFDEDDNPFPEGSGLEGQKSDVVGEISARLGTDYDLNYRFQLDSGSLASKRHEVDATAEFGPLALNTRYLYARHIEGSLAEDSREQIYGRATYRLSDQWRLRASALRDLGDSPGLRKAALGFDYLGQCFNFSATAKRNLTDDASGESGAEIMFRIGLKNLGEFETSGLSLDGSDEAED